jgi:hypothetical protein
MSKYTTEQLQEMAGIVLKHPAMLDPRTGLLLQRLQTQFGLSHADVMHRIDLLAAGLPVTH